jgi:glycosyltransferase involved in cell wall biosynthesis
VTVHIAINGRFYTQLLTGVQRYAREFVAALDSMLADGSIPDGIVDVSVIMPSSGAHAVPRFKAIRPIVAGGFAGHAWEQIVLPRIARSADVLFCPGNSAPLLSLMGGRPAVATMIHDLSHLYFPSAYSWKYRFLYSILSPLVIRHSRMLFTVSQSERRAILNLYPEAAQRLFAVDNGGLPSVHNEMPATAMPVLPRNFVLYVGSVYRRKNFDRLLAALRKLNKDSRVELVVVGSVNAALAKSGDTDTPDWLHMIGQISDFSVLQEIYRRASCFVFPSLYESSGLPPIEAMAHGCPVVVSDIPALRERCADAAIYCDPHSVDDIARAVNTLLASPDLARQLRDAGTRRAALFSWQRCVSETLPLLLRAGSTVGVRASGRPNRTHEH